MPHVSCEARVRSEAPLFPETARRGRAKGVSRSERPGGGSCEAARKGPTWQLVSSLHGGLHRPFFGLHRRVGKCEALRGQACPASGTDSCGGPSQGSRSLARRLEKGLLNSLSLVPLSRPLGPQRCTSPKEQRPNNVCKARLCNLEKGPLARPWPSRGPLAAAPTDLWAGLEARLERTSGRTSGRAPCSNGPLRGPSKGGRARGRLQDPFGHGLLARVSMHPLNTSVSMLS